MTNTQLREFYSALRTRGKLHGTILAAMTKHKQREKLRTPPGPDLATRFEKAHVLVELSRWQADATHKRAVAARPRVRNWELPQAVRRRCSSESSDTNAGSYRGAYSRYSIIKHTPIVQSVGFITPSGLRYTYDGKSVFLRHPHGYRWRTDDYGVVLVSLADGADYHPDGEDLIRLDGSAMSLRSITAKLRERRSARRLTAKKNRLTVKQAKQAAAQGVCVRLQDSLDSGNCRAGTRAWASNRGLQGLSHISPLQLLDSLTDKRVCIVLAAAIKRHKQSIRRGYSHV